MNPIRVLVVEDSATVRARLVEVISSDPQLVVVGEAADGRAAIEMCQRLRPDVMTLDMMLPVMTGLAATEFIMAHFPTPILVVSASFNRGEVFKTYDALASGAVDVIEKPTGQEPPGVWEREFLTTLRVVSKVKVITHPRARLQGWSAHPPQRPVQETATGADLSLVAIGVSTGGPNVLLQLLRDLPADFSAPVLIVMHIAAPFATAFAEWITAQSGRSVKFAVDSEPLERLRGCVRLAPPDRHLIVQRGRLVLSDDPERHSCRPSVDELFESLAREMGKRTVACLLTGMGRDGARGLLALRNAGAHTIAQDEATSVVFGMPREGILLGAAMHVLALPDIVPHLVGLFKKRGGDR